MYMIGFLLVIFERDLGFKQIDEKLLSGSVGEGNKV